MRLFCCDGAGILSQFFNHDAGSCFQCLIATFCLENSHQLLHNDSDFAPFEKELGLQVI
jgi:hypothetical protein